MNCGKIHKNTKLQTREKRIEFQTRKAKEASNSAPFSQIERESQNFIYLLNWFCAFYDPIWRIIDFIILFLATGATIKKTFTQPTQRTFLYHSFK